MDDNMMLALVAAAIPDENPTVRWTPKTGQFLVIS
jgi:hypothetical protein